MPDLALIEQLDQAIDALLKGSAPDGPTGLMEIAATLQSMPDERFKTRLATELERKASTPTTTMPTATTTGSAVIHAITPFIVLPEGDKLIDFMKHTFNAEEYSRHPHGSGFVAGMRIGTGEVHIMGGESTRGRERPAALHVYVKDCDAAYRRALEAGAITVDPEGMGLPADRPYGERAAFVRDPFGNLWNIATRLGPDYVGIGLRHVTPGLLPAKAPPLIDFLKRVFGAELDHPFEEDGRLVHVFVHIGEYVLEMGEATDEDSRPGAFLVDTDDVDTLYDRAMAAGATSTLAPSDQSFASRMAVFLDPAGNQWIPTKRL